MAIVAVQNASTAEIVNAPGSSLAVVLARRA